MQKNNPFGLSHYRPRVPYQLPMVTAHQIRDMKLHPTAGMVILFYEDVAPLVVNAEWADLMKPKAGQYLVTAPRGGVLLMQPAQLQRLFKKKEIPDVRERKHVHPAGHSAAESAGSVEGQRCAGCTADKCGNTGR